MSPIRGYIITQDTVKCVYVPVLPNYSGKVIKLLITHYYFKKNLSDYCISKVVSYIISYYIPSKIHPVAHKDHGGQALT